MSPIVVWCALTVAQPEPPGSVLPSQLARVVDLREFVESFDRTFLPTAKVAIP